MSESLLSKIESKDISVAVIGLGYVGLPLVHSMCSKQINVVGFDIDPIKVEKLNEGKSYLETVDQAYIKRHVEQGLFRATSNFNELSDTDIIIICVPTPLNEHKDPDLSYIVDTVKSIAKTLRKDQLIVLESTTYPGTLDDVVKPILEEQGMKSGEDFFLAYSPEREDPGNKDFETSTTPKVVGGDGKIALQLSEQFYSHFISEIVTVSSTATAEAVKITENIFRSVNIALVNELKVLYEKMGIDIWEVIEAAKTKPFGYMPFYPGPGLGGHCIPIDPFYLSWKAKELDMTTRFIELAGEINTSMPNYVVQKTADALSVRKQKAVNGSNILVIGLAYKKNINDQRETPAFPIIAQFENQGASVDFYDPYISEIMPSRRFSSLCGKQSISWSPEKLSFYDAVIIITDHDNINYEELANNASLVIDTRNALKTASSRDNIIKA